jgi:ABC-type antimicrobial peptide transport system permease subunit
MQVPRGDPAAVLLQAERIAWSLSPSTNVYGVETMAARLDELNWRVRFASVILGIFAAIGLVLAAGGLYAVVSYGVAERRREIGIRMALGATAARIVAAVVGDTVLTVGVGLAIGNLAAVWSTRGLAGLLYGVAPGDPATLAAASISMLAVAAVACAIPAIGAARVDPQIAVRD